MRLLLLLLLLPLTVHAQSAQSLFPDVVGSTWTYNVEITLPDSSTQSATRVDVLTGLENTDNKQFISIISSAGGLQAYELSQDTVKATLNVALPLAGVLPLDDFTRSLLDFSLPQTTLFVTTATLNSRNELNQLRQRIPTPQQLRDAIEQDAGIFSVKLGDSLDVVVSQAFRRIQDEIITLPAGNFNTLVFQSLAGINIEVDVRSILGTIRLTVPLLEDYIITSWYAQSTGLVRQQANMREISIDDNQLTMDVDFDAITIPGFDITLTSFTEGAQTSSADTELTPQTFSLGVNYPNPFNPSSTIPFELSNPAYIQLDIYDVTGRRIKRLVDGYFGAGQHQTQFTADINMSSGIYIYALTIRDDAGNTTRLHRSMLLIK